MQVQADTQGSNRAGVSEGKVMIYANLYIILKSWRKERKPENKGLGLSLQLLAVCDDSVSFVLVGKLDDV